MNLQPARCPDCGMYLGIVDTDGEIANLHPMPHIPGCAIGDREREAMAAADAYELAVRRMAGTTEADMLRRRIRDLESR